MLLVVAAVVATGVAPAAIAAAVPAAEVAPTAVPAAGVTVAARLAGAIVGNALVVVARTRAVGAIPAALVTDIATDPNGSVREIGTGQVAMLYVIVPVGGALRVASGPVYSFYQFEQPIGSRLTDADWWQALGIQPSQTGAYDFSAVRDANAGVVPWVSDFTRNTWDA